MFRDSVVLLPSLSIRFKENYGNIEMETNM